MIPQARTLLLLLVGGLAAAQHAGMDLEVRAVLMQQLRFSAAELDDLQRGQVVKHGLPTRSPGEVAVVGGVRVQAAKAAFFARVRDIARFKSGPEVLQIGRFGNPPSPADLAALTIDKDDFDVRSCRVGDCDIRLPAEVIRRFASEIDPNAPDAQARGVALFKQLLFEDVAAYLSGGARRLTQYDDGPKPIHPQQEFEGILANMPEIGALMPGLPDHLRHFPSSRLRDAEDFLYWSKEKFGIAPFISVTHVTIVCRSAPTCLMTTKDVYSSRYLDASVALAIAADAGGTPEAFDLIYENRTRANALKGSMAGLRRSMAERRARAGLEASLKTVKTQLEKDRARESRPAAGSLGPTDAASSSCCSGRSTP
jgi:hypothetical protein